MRRKKKKRGITPWKKTAMKVCVLWLLLAAGIHGFRWLKAASFVDQREASRWGAAESCAQISAFLPAKEAMKEENIQELEYKINTSLAQDSIKLTAEGEDARLWQDCYSGVGSLTLDAGSKSVTVEAVGTGGAFFTFHPLELSGGSYYLSDSIMKDEILLDQETAWKLFGSFDVEGRTVRVQDMYLRISGVYKKGEGSLYEKGGLPDYVVFVQYKTLLQYGGSGSGSDAADQAAQQASSALIPATAASPASRGTAAHTALLASADEETGDDGSGDETEQKPEEAGQESGEAGGSTTETGGSTGDTGSSAAETGSGSGGSGGSTGQSGENTPGTADGDNTQSTENLGTSNTNYKDTGMITTYEIVMPDPVEGYAAAVVAKAFGDDSEAVIVDNTNRYGTRNLVKDLQNFALLGMRTTNVRYPYWENVAIGWELIFAALFLLECVLIAFTVLLIVWMIVHWYRNKAWTLAGSVQNLQESVYERQSRKKYPEYYKEREQEEYGEEQPSRKETQEAPSIGDHKDKGMLEDKGLTPFEKIRQNRKAVQYEAKHQEDDQRAAGSSAGSEHDSVR